MYKTIIVIPCYKVDKHIIGVLKNINYKQIYKVFLIDDNCPNKTGILVKKKIKNKKIQVIFLKKNLGVGGATKVGILKSLKFKPHNIIKLDGDGQHNPKLIKNFIKFQKKNPNAYIKGYRNLNFFNIPKTRFIGNLLITTIIKFLTFNFTLRDVVNGFISIPRTIYLKINLDNISDDYFFEQDLIFNISLNNFKIKQIKISTIYNKKINSSLNEIKVIIPFFLKYINLLFIKIKKKFND